MQTHLDAFTDIAEFVIFDPTVVGTTTGDRDRPEELLASATSTGAAIAYSFESDGAATFRILVDETPPEEWLKRRRCGVEGARLRVPSGRLMAAGAEYVFPELSAEDATEVTIAPGDYIVDAFDIDWDSAVLDSKLRSMAGSTSVRFENLISNLIGLGLMGIFFGLCAIFWSWLGHSWTPLKVAGVLLGVYWAILTPILLVARLSKVADRVGQARCDLAQQFPDTVLWLRPFGDLSEFNAGRFGSGYVTSNPDGEMTGQPEMGCIGMAFRTLLFCFVVAFIIAMVTVWVS